MTAPVEIPSHSAARERTASCLEMRCRVERLRLLQKVHRGQEVVRYRLGETLEPTHGLLETLRTAEAHVVVSNHHDAVDEFNAAIHVGLDEAFDGGLIHVVVCGSGIRAHDDPVPVELLRFELDLVSIAGPGDLGDQARGSCGDDRDVRALSGVMRQQVVTACLLILRFFPQYKPAQIFIIVVRRIMLLILIIV